MQAVDPVSVINGRLFGVLVESHPAELYRRLSKHSILVAREGFDMNAKHIVDLDIVEAFNVTTHKALLDDFLTWHKIRQMSNQTEFTPLPIIVIEVEAYLTKEAEWCLLMYAYLLRTQCVLPRLYALLMTPVKATIEIIERLLQIAPEQATIVPPSVIFVRDYYVNAQDYFDIAKRSQKHVMLDSSGNRELIGLLKDDISKESSRRIVICRRLQEVLDEEVISSKEPSPGKPASPEKANSSVELALGVMAPDLVCIDATIKVSVSSLYAGNRRVRKPACESYLAYAVEVIKKRYPSAKVVILKTKDNEVGSMRDLDADKEVVKDAFTEQSTSVIRESVFCDFANDIVLFDRHQVSMRLLYANYAPDDIQLRSRIVQTENTIERLHLSKSERFLLTVTRMHPMIAKIVSLWHPIEQPKKLTEQSSSNEPAPPQQTISASDQILSLLSPQEARTVSASGRMLPLFPILLFASVVQAFDKTTREVKEHGLKEVDDDFGNNCRLGIMMRSALESIIKWRTIDTPALGELGVVLKRLVSKYNDVLSEEADNLDDNFCQKVRLGAFDLNAFRRHLATLLREHFSEQILSRVHDGAKTGAIPYRNTKHPNITWRVAGSPPFSEIFPLISMLERSGHRVLLFVPL